MRLPFSHEQFLDVFRAYNLALWPATVALWLLTLAGAVSLARGRANSRYLAGLLALHWVWSGAVYHLGYFVAINPAARLFGALFVSEGLLIAWCGVIRSPLTFVWRRDRGLGGALAVAFTAYALAYPFLAVAAGLTWPRVPSFGVPCPTTLFTIGLLLSVEPPAPRFLSVIPLAWTLIGGSAALLLGVLPDGALLLGGVVLLTQILAPRMLIRNPAA